MSFGDEHAEEIAAVTVTEEPNREFNDSRVYRVVEEYCSLLRAGLKPDRKEFLARYPELAERLTGFLDAVEFVEQAGSQLFKESGQERLDAKGTAFALSSAVPLGDYRIVREVGRGGMGVVYEAEQLSLGRKVALKVLPFAGALDAKQLQRFKNEALAAGRLHHQNIVPVYAVGCERGVHYYAMQFIEGTTLAALIEEMRQARGLVDPGQRTISPEQVAGEATGSDPPGDAPVRYPSAEAPTCSMAARSTVHSTKDPAFFRTVGTWGVQAAHALEHAHQLGVIHRDIKPANLLVDERGHLWITDFGLALFQADANLTMTGDLLGTVRYMSPEQASAKRVLIDQRTDVYSLGATLYEMLVLEPVFPGHNLQELLSQIAFQEPQPPRRFNKSIPPDLETIVLKALEKNPLDRYSTAQEFADDLQRFLDDRSIQAKRPTLLQRTRKWTRRHKSVVWSAAVSAFVLLVLTATGLAVSNQVISRALTGEQQANQELKDILAREHQNSYFQRISLAHRHWLANDVLRAEQLLDECPAELRHWEWHYLKRLCAGGELTLRTKARQVNGVAFSPDGRRLASVGGRTVTIWDAKAGNEILTLPGETCVAFSPDNRHVAFAQGADVKICEAGTGKEVFALSGHGEKVSSIAYAGDGKRLASVAGDRLVKVWDTASGKELLSFRANDRLMLTSVAFSTDGKRLATAAGDQRSETGPTDAAVWDAATGDEIVHFHDHQGHIDSIAFSPNGALVASAGWDRTVKVWDAKTGHEKLTLTDRPWDLFRLDVGLRTVAFSPDGERLAVAGWDRTVRVWQVGDNPQIPLRWARLAGLDRTIIVRQASIGEVLFAFRGHTDVVRSVAFSPDGNRIASCGEDGTVKIWNATTGQEALELRGHDDPVRYLTFAPRGHRLATAGGNDIKIWDAKKGRELLSFRADDHHIRGVVFDGGGKGVRSIGALGTVKTWNATNGQLIHTQGPLRRGVGTVSFTGDGQFLGLLTDNTFESWNLKTGQLSLTLRPASGDAVCTAYSPNGKYVGMGSNELLEVWDATTGQLVQKLNGHTEQIHSLAFSPDGRRIASASTDRTIRIWDIAAGKELLTLRGHAWPIRSFPIQFTSLAFSPDGRRLVSVSDKALTLWDVDTGQELLALDEHAQNLTGVAFSPDGRRIASASADGAVKIWNGTALDDNADEQDAASKE